MPEMLVVSGLPGVTTTLGAFAVQSSG